MAQEEIVRYKKQYEEMLTERNKFKQQCTQVRSVIIARNHHHDVRDLYAVETGLNFFIKSLRNASVFTKCGEGSGKFENVNFKCSRIIDPHHDICNSRLSKYEISAKVISIVANCHHHHYCHSTIYSAIGPSSLIVIIITMEWLHRTIIDFSHNRNIFCIY